MISFALRVVVVLTSSWFIVSCGGGGGSGPAPQPPPPPPVISVQPQAATVPDGQPATFSVVASGTGLQFRWQRNGVDIAGANGAAYTTPATTFSSDNGAQYAVIVANAGGSVASVAASLIVTPLPVSISSQPQPAMVSDGDAATFTISASGTAPIAYQWRRNGANLAGATSATHITPPLVLGSDNGAEYSVLVTNPAGSLASATAAVTVNAVAPQISAAPEAVTVPDGGQATFRVIARGSVPLGYQWLRNGSPITGATGTELTLAAVFADSGAQITVRVSNVAGSTTSGPVAMTVSPLAPSISLHPQDIGVLRGGVPRFSVSVSGGTPPISLQWQRSDDGLNWLDIAGATGADYSLSAGARYSDLGSLFRVRVTNPATSTNSSAARLTVSSSLVVLAGAPGGSGYFNGTGTDVRFRSSLDVAASPSGDTYVADGTGGLRRISPQGAVTTVVPGAGVNVTGVAVEPAGTIVFAETISSSIRRVEANGSVTLVAGGAFGAADGQGTAARFRNPRGLVVDSQGNIFVADTDNHAIRRISLSGMVTTVAGSLGFSGNANGAANASQFNEPHDVALDAQGAVYVADTSNRMIRRVANGSVTTIAGVAGIRGTQDGSTNAALFYAPLGVAVDATGAVFVTDGYDPANTIRKVANGAVSTFAGVQNTSGYVDAQGPSARFRIPGGATIDAAGHLLVAEWGNATVRRISPIGVVTTLAGLGQRIGSFDYTGTDARFFGPGGVAVGVGGDVFVSDLWNRTIRRIRVADAFVSSFAGSPNFNGQTVDGLGGSARFSQPGAMTADAAGNLYVADAAEHVIRKITPAGEVTTFVGSPKLQGDADGIGDAARLNWPVALAYDGQGGLYVADLSFTIRRVDLSTRQVLTVAGTPGANGDRDGVGSQAQFSIVRGLAVESGGAVLISDYTRLRRMTPNGVVSTVAGTSGSIGSNDGVGAQARFGMLGAIALDAAGNAYVSDEFYSTIRRITRAGVVTTFLGQPDAHTVRTGANPLVNTPRGIAFLPDGAIVLTSENAILLY